ncbi:hypothetical protein [Psychrobacter fulvigenes]|uniref:hypothetical protein n=1 Tax=Psychrobacter fulvigenes TaxID=533323 RepID=UPI0038798E37
MEIKAPDLGVDSAEVSEIMVQVGDVIEKRRQHYFNRVRQSLSRSTKLSRW